MSKSDDRNSVSKLAHLIRFIRYTVVGFTTFLIDLFLIYFLTEILHINYLISVGLAFIVAVTLNYHYSRKYVFCETTRELYQGYFNFLVIAILGLILIILLMAILVEVFSINYIVARVLVACLVGIYNYLTNLLLNFKI